MLIMLKNYVAWLFKVIFEVLTISAIGWDLIYSNSSSYKFIFQVIKMSYPVHFLVAIVNKKKQNKKQMQRNLIKNVKLY